MKKIILLFCLLIICTAAFCQTYLHAGFDGKEYIDLLKVTTQQGDTMPFRNIPVPENYPRVYRSREVGLLNRWDLWYRNDQKSQLSASAARQHHP